MWRKLILGKGAKDEQEKGVSGNSILLAQARPDELADVRVPQPVQIRGLNCKGCKVLGRHALVREANE